jgi:hypothetical protein
LERCNYILKRRLDVLSFVGDGRFFREHCSLWVAEKCIHKLLAMRVMLVGMWR